jgi:hypothetical protein
MVLFRGARNFDDSKDVLAHGQTQGSTLTTHQQALTIGPFGNTCEADAVSPEVAIGGCRTEVFATRGNAKWIQGNTLTQI